ncbi:MAG TPA: aminotransferase class V-fold PLP-dependent enzyme [Kofleriaceae bacterium]
MTNLRLTGPTPLPPEVRDALGLPMVSHRSDGFRACLRDVQHGLQQVLATREVPIVLSGSGTTALELAVANAVEPGTRVLALSIGHFGERFAELARRYGGEVELVRAPAGQAIDPQAVREALRRARFDVALVTHVETSTGAINDLAALVRELRAGSDALVLVDAVSSLGGTPCAMAALELDVVASASQKALMAPPGLAIAAASPRALARARRIASPRGSLDLVRLHAAAAEHTTLFTPAIPIVRALQAALRLLLDAGLDAVYARTRDAAAGVPGRARRRRAGGARGAGLRLADGDRRDDAGRGPRDRRPPRARAARHLRRPGARRAQGRADPHRPHGPLHPGRGRRVRARRRPGRARGLRCS